MPLPVIPGVLRLAVKYDSLGVDEVLNIVHVLPTPGSFSDQMAVAQAFYDIWWPAPSTDGVRSEVASVNTLVEITVDSLDGSGAQTVFNPGILRSGAQSGAALPAEVSMCVGWRTGMSGRSNRGRTYLPPSSQASFDTGANRWDNGYVSSVAQVCNAMIDDLATADVPLVVASYLNLAYNLVTEARTDNIVDSQRRRRT